jgi:hypothetical protein
VTPKARRFLPVPAMRQSRAARLSQASIYDSVTGRTQVVADPLEIFGFNPQREPPGLLPGLR